ncbi:hypothetical protein EGW08_009367, partial [Elysia chlorotica]
NDRSYHRGKRSYGSGGYDNHRGERHDRYSGRGRRFGGSGRGHYHTDRDQDEDRGFRGRGGWRARGRGRARQESDWRMQEPGGNQDEEGGASGNRPPPHLKGRDIGLWYARKSQARKEREEKTNRPRVSMDKETRQDIRQLLDSLQTNEGGGTSTDGAADSHKHPQPSGSQSGTGWGSGAIVTPSLAPSTSKMKPRLPPPSSSSSSSVCVDVLPGPALSSSHTTFVYRDENRDQKIVPDSWEMRSDSDSDEEEKDEEMRQVDNHESSKEAIDFDQYDNDDDDDDEDDGDDDGIEDAPSVSGVVQYMESHEEDLCVEAAEPVDVPESGDPDLDREMSEKMRSLDTNQNFVKMLEFRKKLPSYTMREKIVATIDGSQVLVISGETGCGKTTQVPQFILDSYIDRGIGSQCRIICTQPRRISAISVAERVAAERCERVNDSGKCTVGYQIRLENKRPRLNGSILFCTTGIVLKFLEGDPDLHRATHIVIDEIHERDLQSDFLMIILKDLLLRRTDLKVILMSATLNAEMFSQYFDGCPMLNIPGYTFPVKEYLLEDIIEMTQYNPDCTKRPARKRSRPSQEEREEEEDYKVWCRNLRDSYSHRTIDTLKNFDYSAIDIDLIHHIINHIMAHMEDGAILVFVPGWEEIKKLHQIIEHSARYKSGGLRVIPLHSLMPTVNQREVFERPPPGVRKIVIATNIAETSITIDDVVFVIDCGKIKVKDFRPEMNLTSLEPQWVSKANAKQRRGRAGRVQAGHCFHLYTKFCYDSRQDYLPPEMLRTRLEELCLQIKLLKLGMIVPFIGKAMEHPSMEAIQHAVDTLIDLQSLDRAENLLPLGYHMARMPVEPHTGKMILFGAMFCCLDPVLTVAASLSFKDAFTIPLGKEGQADEARKRLSENSKSDHIMLINAFRGWENSLKYGESQSYCWQNFLSPNTLKMLRDMKQQLAELLYNIGFVGSKNPKDEASNINSGSWSMIRAVLCAGLYPNVAQVTKVPKPRGGSKPFSGVKMSVKGDGKVFAHPKSVNYVQSFFESKWMVFYHKLKTSKVYVHDSTMISAYPLLFFGGEIEIIQEEGTELVSIDNWVKFKADRSTAMLVKDLRRQLDKLLGQKITKPGPTRWSKGEKEGALMTAISDLICTETSSASGGIGKAPSRDGSIGRDRYRGRAGSSWN